MTVLNRLKKAAGAVTGKSMPRILTVKDAKRITPNMIRVVFSGPELEGFPVGQEGGNCKLLLPEVGEDRDAFIARLQNGQKPVRRTYTVRSFDPELLELSIDFVAHGDEGPASRCATHAAPGAFLGFQGPSAPKVTKFDADWYLVAADPSALPVAAATLEAMPRDARGMAIFEVTSEEDKQTIHAPEMIEQHWLVHPDPHTPSTAQEAFIRSLTWPEGRVKTCIAGESGVIRTLRAFLHNEKQLPKSDTDISGYWKIGMVEDEHQMMKRKESA